MFQTNLHSADLLLLSTLPCFLLRISGCWRSDDGAGRMACTSLGVTAAYKLPRRSPGQFSLFVENKEHCWEENKIQGTKVLLLLIGFSSRLGTFHTLSILKEAQLEISLNATQQLFLTSAILPITSALLLLQPSPISKAYRVSPLHSLELHNSSGQGK